MSKKTLRQRVSTYFRQLSFINEPRVPISNRRTGEDFIRKYLDGSMPERARCPGIQSGRDPEDMPELEVKLSIIKSSEVIAFTGPDKGIGTVERSKLHLSAGGDIDFIDNNNLESDFEVRRSKRANAQRFGGIVSGPCASRLLPHSLSSNKKKAASPEDDAEEDNSKISLNTSDLGEALDLIAGLSNWSVDSDYACGMSTSLYERNPITEELTGSPIADCFALISRRESCILALADGVNWGEKACLAARAAIRGSVEYLETALFGLSGTASERTLLTRDIFISLLRSLWEGHNCILEVGGALTTLTIAVVVPVTKAPTTDNERVKWMVCACNVGDSLGFVYSQRSGVREFTQASHDTTTARDMRDALGALGPVDGTKPELSNLTLSMTEVEEDDIVFLTSDGVSDNFDPVVGKFAIAASETPDLASVKTRLKVAGGSVTGNQRPSGMSTSNSSSSSNARPKLQPLASTQQPQKPARPQYNRSRTVIEPPRRELRSPFSGAGFAAASPRVMMQRSPSILPHVTAEQRHALTLLRLEDLLAYGINGTLQPCNSSRKLCQLLIDFSKMITAARRNMLEQRETYVRLVTDPATGLRRESELNRIQQRAARKRLVDSSTFQSLPGKLDHASVVAFMCRRAPSGTEKVPPSANIQSGRSRDHHQRGAGATGRHSAVIETDL